jgi:hypothetical protein
MSEPKQPKGDLCKTTGQHCNQITPRELFEKELANLKAQTQLQLRAMEAASEKSAAILDERLERMNEFRAAMQDQGATFVTRAELDLKLEAIERDVRALRDFASEHRGAASATSVYVTGALALISLAVSLWAVLQ